jgi:bacterioferritin-associated ferredoxin
MRTMKQAHITDIIDDKPLAALSESELEPIRAHCANCIDCARAFAAAQLSELLMKEHASEAAEHTLNANPFFQTRVLASWREQHAPASAWSLGRLWSATGALVSSMAATTAVLAALTFIIPAEEATVQRAALVPASAESVMLYQGQEDLTNEQALSAIYYDEEEAR